VRVVIRTLGIAAIALVLGVASVRAGGHGIGAVGLFLGAVAVAVLATLPVRFHGR
jgi:hypothetical protein